MNQTNECHHLYTYKVWSGEREDCSVGTPHNDDITGVVVGQIMTTSCTEIVSSTTTLPPELYMRATSMASHGVPHRADAQHHRHPAITQAAVFCNPRLCVSYRVTFTDCTCLNGLPLGPCLLLICPCCPARTHWSDPRPNRCSDVLPSVRPKNKKQEQILSPRQRSRYD